ncbi:MAG: hypothetical protein DMF64_11495 [Acidobacteria bacterium]|nr:MAG: hypothetical protein DMF64_11495 [Acidobacteriota bacterium]
MHDDEKEARTFNDEQQKMFGDSEAYQAGAPVRAHTPGVATPPATDILPPPTDATSEPAETEVEAEPRLHVVAVRGEGGTDITGGTDKYGPGGLADSERATTEGTGATETGDVAAGASSTHAGAGGNQGPTGGTGTAPTE